MNWVFGSQNVCTVATLVAACSLALLNVPTAADDAPRKPQPLVLCCSFAEADTDLQFVALFVENEKGRLSWDVSIDAESKSVPIVGALQAQIEWELPAPQREELQCVLETIRAKRARLILFLAEGIWGDEDPTSQWPNQARELIITSIHLSELGTAPAYLRYEHLTAEDLRGLTDRQLVRAYERIGTKLFGTQYEPGAFPPPCALILDGYTKAKLADFEAIRREIVRRGDALVPLLIRFLRQEVADERERAVSPRDAKFLGLRRRLSFAGEPGPSFANDIVHLLVAIGNPKPAELFLQIAEDSDGKTRPSHRSAAMAGLQRLTYLSLRPLGPGDGSIRLMIEHPLATEIQYADDRFERQLAFFREWLAGEGKDPADWLPLARRRARSLLESDDPASVYFAAHFLQPLGHDPLRGGTYEIGRDDQPVRTMDRIAEVMAEFGISDVRFVSLRNRGYPVPGDRGSWVQLLTSYGTRARKHAALITRFRLHNQQLLEVGGDEILEYLFERLESATDSKVWVRQTVDRWAGRAFETDGDRKQWWKANRDRSDEERLRASLPTLVAQSDKRDPNANRIVETVLPDAPPFYEQDEGGNYLPGPSRVQWLGESLEQLRYEPVRGVFRLPES